MPPPLNEAPRLTGDARQSLRVSLSISAPTGSLKGREARAEERFRELAAWYVLQGRLERADAQSPRPWPPFARPSPPPKMRRSR